MVKKILGWLLFVWMSIAVIGASRDMLTHGGVRLGAELGAAVFCAVLAVLGLVMALSRPPRKDDGDLK